MLREKDGLKIFWNKNHALGHVRIITEMVFNQKTVSDSHWKNIARTKNLSDFFRFYGTYWFVKYKGPLRNTALPFRCGIFQNPFQFKKYLIEKGCVMFKLVGTSWGLGLDLLIACKSIEWTKIKMKWQTKIEKENVRKKLKKKNSFLGQARGQKFIRS